MDNLFAGLGFAPADILLPKEGTDMEKWAVIACDQFTSQPEYWQAVEKEAGTFPSAYRLILPEAHLNAPDVDERIARINANMEQYLNDGVFRCFEDALIYTERTQTDGKIRHGLIGPGVYASHGYERSHVDGVYATMQVIKGFLNV